MSDLVSAAGGRVRHTATWLHVDGPRQRLPEHGWKFHISSRFADLPDLVLVLVPYLLAEGCTFKVARSAHVLSELNDGITAPPSVGKAVTIYPVQDRVPHLGAGLVELLRGRAGPQVLSDRRLAADAPVYYRYGPFSSTLVAGRDGNLRSVMTGPGGDTFEGTATLTYHQPPWATDPFRASAAEVGAPGLLGNHYQPLKGLLESVRGNVYAATDVRTGETVVVKQARAYVAESPDGDDTRIRLRNERFVLTALRDVPGVARFRDHFRHGLDEYLVTSFDGKFSLTEDIARKGRYLPLAGSRSLDTLACRLAGILRAIHARGYLLRDLSAKNIVVSLAGDAVTFIDFGHCNHHDVKIRGGTRGYAPARQVAGEPAVPGDDLHAFGMTLFVALTGAEPLLGDDPDTSRVTALRMLDRIYGDRLPPVVALITDLLSGEPETMASAFTTLADARPPGDGSRARRHTLAPHRRGPDTAALVERVLASLLSRVNHVLDQPEEVLDASVYRGTAGIGLSLLPHLDRPGVAATVTRLAAATARTAERVKLRPALYLGTTGAEIFLRRAHATPLPAELLFGQPGESPDGDDIIVGGAGIALGHLLLNELDPRPEHETIVRRRLDFISASGGVVSFFPAPRTPIPGLDTTVGVAHGQAGLVEFLRQYARRHPSAPAERLLATRAAMLAEQVSKLVGLAAEPSAVPLCASWCRGMAGMGRVLLAAGRHLHDAALIDTAVACADGCLRWLPYLATPGQCCGVAGIGELFCDLADHEERFLAAAESAATQLLVLGADTPPAVPVGSWSRPNGLSWASGAGGVLGFLTHLRDLTPAPGAVSPF
ncbi:lanthionine synthetase LanC family protein [Nonomuraea sp. NPDC050394]|uniref:class III lanthionine synthetase LanKC N-terminal domain-containing protein n=1 Tax=Nonomuraea sp. NPDC050394 TaxID=3364363 RepID=UPI0037A933AE